MIDHPGTGPTTVGEEVIPHRSSGLELRVLRGGSWDGSIAYLHLSLRAERRSPLGGRLHEVYLPTGAIETVTLSERRRAGSRHIKRGARVMTFVGHRHVISLRS